MKQKTYMAALLAGMLALAGCGGGSSGISEEDAAARAERAVQDALAGITPCEGDGVMINDDGECVLDPDHTSEADMSAMSKALYAALSPDNGFGDGTNGLDRTVTFEGTDNDLRIATNPSNIDLKKTDASVPALAGWSGAQYTTTDDGEINREAHVYTKVNPGKEGKMFATTDSGKVGTGDDDTHRYQLILLGDDHYNIGSAGITRLVNTVSIMIDSFTQTAGSREYEKPDGSTASYVSEAGSYHGVRGTFYCSGAPGDACKVNHAGENKQTFETVGSWRFVPSDPNARVTMDEDAPLASYGWWLDKSDSDDWSVGVFDANRGSVQQLSQFNLDSGSATYRGGAAGKYALTSSTGGRNEAGHFTASVELMAKFGAGTGGSTGDTISGTVSDFKNGQGADIDGQWKVALGESMIADTGAISAAGDKSKTTWSVGETAGTAAGSWSGNMWKEGDDGVPDIVTGTFNAHLGNDGRMAGAFGADHVPNP